jgi:glutamate synthase domain-containing protein 1
MCGIVGLLIKDPSERSKLGPWMTPMLIEMGARGPESAGLAVFDRDSGASDPGQRQFSLHAPAWDYDWAPLEAAVQVRAPHSQLRSLGNHARVTGVFAPAEFKAWVAQEFPGLHLLSAGTAIDVYKDIGHPARVAERYRFSELAGSHVVGHTRMATESAVTPDRAHPFTAGEDFCLVHNGTISNPFMVRRKLEHAGIQFQTDNDSEAACRFIEWRLREGDDLEGALAHSLEELDGFYTFLIGTRDRLALLRDAFACKPAIAAETADYVAISSEFRALAHLPGIERARLFEPMPGEIYTWSV